LFNAVEIEHGTAACYISTVMNKSPGRGRRAGAVDTRALIRDAARARFLAHGYQAVTLREVAADAGVDVALISYYFGSKHGLFSVAMALPVNPVEMVASHLDGDLNTLAERLLRSLLTVWDSPDVGAQMQAAARAALNDPTMTNLVRDGIVREIIDKVAERLGGPDGAGRAAAFAIQAAGVIFTRYLLKVEPIASMSADEIVRHLAPSLQLVLDR
jgi:AcrR family transcriptional regulator